MKTTTKYIIMAIGILLAGFLLGWLVFSGNEREKEHVHDTAGQKETTWTCSMHPQVRKTEPGKCPICGMDLIPLNNEEDNLGPNVFRLSETAIKLANIQTMRVGKSGEKTTIGLSGKIVPDERRVYSQTAHFPGRIEELYVNFTGEEVKKGQVIAKVYSPELITAQEELLEAAKYKNENPTLYSASKKKLSYWKLSQQQISAIESTGRILENFPIRANVSGVVAEKNVNVGDHIKEGTILYRIADLEKVWAQFDAYQSDLPYIDIGDSIYFEIRNQPGKDYKSTVSFVDPVINKGSRVAYVRTEVENPEGEIKPEMLISGRIISSSEKKETNRLTVPKSAVMWTGKRSIVYIKKAVDGEPLFELREVVLGPVLQDQYVIREGITEGEQVVINGTFTVDAAAQLKGKNSMMSSVEEQTPSEKTDIMPVDGIDKTEIPSAFRQALGKNVKNYLQLKNALVSSNANKAREHAQDLFQSLPKKDYPFPQNEAAAFWQNIYPKLSSSAEMIMNTDKIEIQRENFIRLSDYFILALKTFGVEEGTLFIQHCPMANNSRGADWISGEEEIRNPYYGEKMLTCGEVTGKIE